ncbi:putative bifunctional diguanylate cyclase/phosphodiesterase [Oceanobacillus halotolerans]|uniref:putative bifunctional diguanylate cyclase/phosphodiesterase n=1 Tax=Oceanobacillus halotolerans TaxID=2663380 RepID=UPI0013D9FA90|nr:GGDEF domain-containing phosphodiesterase [Oceanobacillus halotolerans]
MVNKGFRQSSSKRKKEILAKAFHRMSHAMSVTNENNQIIYVNPAFTKLTGYTEEEIFGRNPNILSSGHHDRNFYKKMWHSIRHHNMWRGEIWNKRKNGELFLEEITIYVLRDEQGKITNHISIFTDITDKKKLEEQIKFQALHDDLTLLPNRNYFYQELDRVMNETSNPEQKFAIIFLDLDRFKEVNDTLGHSIGDDILKESAERLKAAIRNKAFITRYGGDEFIILLKGMKQKSECIALINEMMSQFEQSFCVNNYELYITPSIGVSIFPDDGKDKETLVKHADSAMYEAKQNGKNTYVFYQKHIDQESFEKLMLASDLRSAIKNEEFILYYQPQLCLETKEIIGFEVLIRWNHPVKGMVSPGTFIPLAEETGMITQIDQWVLRNACLQCKKWQDQGYNPVKIAVNLSMLQFQQKFLIETVQDALTSAGLDPYYLELEVTESVIMENTERTLFNIKKLNSIGVKVSLDDFGKHYSSLSYLKKLSLDRLKIDRSFIRDMLTDHDDQIIVKAIINLAHNLNLTVVAEGVEQKEQLLFLESHNCNEIQGFYLSKPLPAQKANNYILEV